MRRRLAFGVLLLAALGLAVTTSAGKPAKPPLGTPVTVTFTDRIGDAIQSDTLGPYANGVAGVTALIVPLGNLQLKTGDTRAFWLDFGACAVGPCDPPFTEPQLRQGYMTTSCPTSLLTMTGWQFCNLNVHFTANGQGWFIRFGQGQGYDTTPATVTRVDDSNWTIAVPEGGIALLQSYPLKGKVTFTNHGYFYMPVSMTVILE
jgi:hypothetical protein